MTRPSQEFGKPLRLLLEHGWAASTKRASRIYGSSWKRFGCGGTQPTVFGLLLNRRLSHAVGFEPSVALLCSRQFAVVYEFF